MSTRGGETEVAERQRSWWALEASEAMAALEASERGLSDDEAARRLERYGPNELTAIKGATLIGVIIRQFTSPLIYILMVAALVTIVLEEYIDAAIIFGVLVFNAIIGTFQEFRAERSMEALLQVATARAHVVRGGREREMDSRELVPGDVIIVEAGAKVPADCRLLYAVSLETDESLLTGESTTVAKNIEPVVEDAPVGDRASMLVLGSVVTRGRGRAVVVSTGAATQLGRIAGSVRETVKAEAPIIQRMNRFAKVIAMIILAASAVGFAAGVALGQDFDDLVLTLVALMVASIPEGLPIVMTVTLAIGVNRMARRNVIIRRLAAVETLGSTTVIGSDKTGTLTQNRMTVVTMYAGGDFYEVTGTGYVTEGETLKEGQLLDPVQDENLRLLLLAGVLNNEAGIEVTNGPELEVYGDPTEIALLVSASKAGLWKEAANEDYPRWGEIPFDSEKRYAATFHHRGDRELMFVKGAPEEVLAMCESDFERASLDREAVLAAAGEMAESGIRVLGFAYREGPRRSEQSVPEEPSGLVFLGLQGMIDPPREGVPEAIRNCQLAGIRVIMITGDHARTALAIGMQIGIAKEGDGTLTGAEIDAMDETEFRKAVLQTPVYARVSPQHKLNIVQALQEHGEVVAVTGDGVNDGPALKAANIGVAMGQTGTDVAKEASDMVITDDNFVSIMAGVEEGRVVFDNVRKVTFFLIATGAAVTVAVLASIFFDFALPLLPAQLIWINLVTNGVQDVFLAFEPGEKDVLKREPRSPREGIISRLLWERTAIAGLVMAIGTVALFLYYYDNGNGDLDQARTVALTTMVLFQVFHIGNSRSEHESVFARSPLLNPWLMVGTALALGAHIGALYWGPTQFILRIEPLSLEQWAIMLAVASTVLIAVDLHKLLRGPGKVFGTRVERAPVRAP